MLEFRCFLSASAQTRNSIIDRLHHMSCFCDFMVNLIGRTGHEEAKTVEVYTENVREEERKRRKVSGQRGSTHHLNNSAGRQITDGGCPVLVCWE